MATKTFEFRRDDLIECVFVAEQCFVPPDGSAAEITQCLALFGICPRISCAMDIVRQRAPVRPPVFQPNPIDLLGRCFTWRTTSPARGEEHSLRWFDAQSDQPAFQ